jgi:uncharacterized protein YyaL (SSP411 family)
MTQLNGNMKSYLKGMTLMFVTVFLLNDATAQTRKSSEEYLKRAEDIYQVIWTKYRVKEYGLFSENFPSSKSASLDYFQEGAVKEKEVSFLWPFSGLFSATNVLIKTPSLRKKYLPYLDSLATGMEQYKDTLRKPVGYQAYPVRFEKVDRYYDDNGLVSIDYMESYFNTENPVYLERAKVVFEFILSGWDEKLGGGVTWLEGHRDQKPACSNGMATLAALKIYEATGDPYYLKWGEKFYNWMHDNLRDSAGVYVNDKKMDGTVNKTYFTYNSGSMLEASVMLYKFKKDKKYLMEAKTIAKGAFNHFSVPGPGGTREFQIDLPWFTTVLFRGYESLYHVDGDYTYIEAIAKKLDQAWENSRDKYGLVTYNWTSTPDELAKPKWLLNETCIAELYGRLSLLNKTKTIPFKK